LFTKLKVKPPRLHLVLARDMFVRLAIIVKFADRVIGLDKYSRVYIVRVPPVRDSV
jgi:hypothetical protein